MKASIFNVQMRIVVDCNKNKYQKLLLFEHNQIFSVSFQDDLKKKHIFKLIVQSDSAFIII